MKIRARTICHIALAYGASEQIELRAILFVEIELIV